MTGVCVACPAKVNLFLRIVAREDSGYHQIETLFQAVGLFDRVDAYAGGEGITLEVELAETAPGVGNVIGELGAPEDNTVVKAARAFFEATGIAPAVSLELTKAIPVGTGLGGGSSDAAGTLAALNALYGEPLRRRKLMELGGRIGSDVPFFCAGVPTALAWGRGDRLLGCPAPPAAPAVLVVPRERVSTAAAYREASAELELPAAPAWLQGVETGDWKALAALQGNDFEGVAFRRMLLLGEVRTMLEGAGAVVARLTGSGSAVFGVFGHPERAREAAGRARAMEGVAAALVVPTLAEMDTP